jgi:septal ring factor EnvC (AmiA/AmiB activator)
MAEKAEKANDRKEHESFKAARDQSSRLTRGVKLTQAERQKFEDTRKRYDTQYKDLEKQQRELDRNHQPDAAVLAKLEALRVQERADIRGMLTPAQQTVFDRNATTVGTRRP